MKVYVANTQMHYKKIKIGDFLDKCLDIQSIRCDNEELGPLVTLQNIKARKFPLVTLSVVIVVEEVLIKNKIFRKHCFGLRPGFDTFNAPMKSVHGTHGPYIVYHFFRVRPCRH